MGFREKKKPIVLTFPGDEDLDGLVVEVQSKTLGEYLEIVGLAEVELDGPVLVRQLHAFGDALISWNWEDADGKPIPPTKAEVFKRDKDQMLKVAVKWFERLEGAVDAPLPQSSPAGEPSPVASIPMETLPAPQLPTAVPA